MRMMNVFLSGLTLAFAVCAQAAPLSLARDGKADCVIVLPATASKTDRFAADELRLHLKRSTGAEFPVVADAAGRPSIELGTAKARAIAAKVFPRVKRVDETAFAARSGDVLALCGEGVRGNAYAVYLFLERALGCRWFTATGIDLVPEHRTFALESFAETETPKILYRTLIGADHDKAMRADGADQLFYFRNRMNMIGGDYRKSVVPELEGALVPRLKLLWPGCHSFFKYIPPEKYFKDHPDWFSQDEKGERVTGRHLCFANAGLRAEMTKNVIAHAKKLGGQGFLDLSQDDAGGELCACTECRASSKRRGTPAGRFFEYLHEIAPELKRECPGIILHTLAYHRDCTQIPPARLARYPDNIAVVFAPIDDDQFKSAAAPSNRTTLMDFRGWAKIANLWLWDYPTLFHQPFGYLGRIGESIRTYAREGLVGGFIEHDMHTRWGGEFADIETWSILQLYRNPELDWRSLRDEFCRGVYGVAAEDVIAYEEELDNRRENLKTRVGPFGRTDVVISEPDILRWQRAFDAMERKAGSDKELVQRLRETRLLLDNLTLLKWPRIKRINPGFGPEAVYDRATNAFARALASRYQVSAAANLRDRANASAFRKSFDANFELAKANLKPLPSFFSKYPEDKVVQLFPARGGYPGHSDSVDDPDAALGWAMKEFNIPKEWQKYPVYIGMYDKSTKTYPARKLALGPEDVKTGVYHFYHVGKCRIPSSEVLVWVGTSWHLHTRACGSCYRPGANETWDLWVSAKVEGPAYDPKSTLKESALYMDRIVLIGPEPGP